MPADDVARFVGPALQRYLTGDLAVGAVGEQNSSDGE
jgi:hypothetical protein